MIVSSPCVISNTNLEEILILCCYSILQDFLVDRLTQKVDRLHEEIAMYEAQTLAQEEETRSAQKTLSEAITEIEVCDCIIRIIWVF